MTHFDKTLWGLILVWIVATGVWDRMPGHVPQVGGCTFISCDHSR